jgi:polyphosphate glucokinase
MPVVVDAIVARSRRPRAGDAHRRSSAPGTHDRPASHRVRVLVIDIGGSNVKIWMTGRHEPTRFNSGKHLTPEALVHRVKLKTTGWKYDAVSIGYPGDVAHDRPGAEPGNLASGWTGFDFRAAFHAPARVVNDAVLQALGAYDGGRMLFLGLGTGVGSALVVDRVIVPLELGNLSYRRKETVADRLGKDGFNRHGRRVWARAVHDITRGLREAFCADYIVIGGGSAKKVNPLPPHVRRGGNEDARLGGFRLWEEQVEAHEEPPPQTWRILG